MKAGFALVPFLLIANIALADDAWKEEARTEIESLQDVTEARWAESGALWVATDKEEQFLEFWGEQVVCAQAYFAKKPKGEILQITFMSASALNQGRLERVKTIFCQF